MSHPMIDPENTSNATDWVYVLHEHKEPSVIRYDHFVRQLFRADTEREMKWHAVTGVCSEAGELADAIKKELAYRKPIDRENIVEELGDLRFYMRAVQNLYGISDQEVLQKNADKLSTRYKDLRYSDVAAVERTDKKD
jgi:NTP pyrophosphatase (non-canonical NTP hydrolase)